MNEINTEALDVPKGEKLYDMGFQDGFEAGKKAGFEEGRKSTPPPKKKKTPHK